MKSTQVDAYACLAGFQCVLGDKPDAQVFDGRDNEVSKLDFWQRFLGPLTIEVLP